MQVPSGLHRCQSCLQSSRDAFSGFISTLLFPIPDLEDWRLSILHPQTPSLHILVLVASGPLIPWCVKESPDGFVEPRNLSHTPRDVDSGRLWWGPRACISNHLPEDIDVPDDHTWTSSALRKRYIDRSTRSQTGLLQTSSSPQISSIPGNILKGNYPPNI